MSRLVLTIAAATIFNLIRAVASGEPDVPVRDPGWLRHTTYDQRLLPQPILEENARRHTRYLGELKDREQRRLAAYREWTHDGQAAGDARSLAITRKVDPIREQLIESLGLHGPSTSFEVRSRELWRWMAPIRTVLSEVEGETVPRNVARRLGIFEEITLDSSIGAVTAILVRRQNLRPPYRVVVCLPDWNPQTGIAGRAADLVGAPHVQSLVEAGFLVVAADLSSLAGLRGAIIKKALLLGEPPVGKMAAQLSVLISYLTGRDDIQAKRIALHGRGLGGFAAALSAAIDTRIWATVVEDGLRSYRRIAENGAELDLPWLMPRMLSYADAPDLVALIAPRPLLVIENGPAPAPWSCVGSARTIAGLFYGFHGEERNFQAVDAVSPRNPSMVAEFLREHLEEPPHDWERLLASDTNAEVRPDRQPPVSITAIQSAAEWNPARARILEEVRALLGGFPDRGTDHSGQIIERGREEGFDWERVFVRTTPETLTPILITRSANVRMPAPALIHISGSSISHEDDALRIAGEMARHGFIGVFACLKSATDFRLGGTPRDALGILEGRPILGEWAWNLMGLIDYLETRADIDRNRIGAMGWSLGATTITYLLPFDERIRAGAGFVAFFQLKGIWDAVQPPGILNGEPGMPFLERHQINSFIPGLLRICDVDDLLATIAPRPLLSLAAEQDEYFPIDSVRNAFARKRHIYTLLGVPDRLEFLEYPGPHAMAPPLRERAWDFFKRHLDPQMTGN